MRPTEICRLHYRAGFDASIQVEASDDVALRPGVMDILAAPSGHSSADVNTGAVFQPPA